jgi:hypothetical protein
VQNGAQPRIIDTPSDTPSDTPQTKTGTPTQSVRILGTDPMKRLTDTAIRAVIVKPRARRIDLADGAVAGLTLRIGRTRGATWSLVFRVVGEGGLTGRGHALKGGKHRISLGSYPEVTLEAARAKANHCLDRAKAGDCPTDELERAATAGGLTVSALADRFVTDYVRMKELRALRKYGVPRI